MKPDGLIFGPCPSCRNWTLEVPVYVYEEWGREWALNACKEELRLHTEQCPG